MVVELILGAAIIIMSAAALVVWLSDMSSGVTSIIVAVGVITVALLVLIAHAVMDLGLVDTLHLLLVLGLITAPVIAIAFAQRRRAS